MPIYQVNICITLDEGEFVVRADSEEEAVQKARDEYETSLREYVAFDTISVHELADTVGITVDID